MDKVEQLRELIEESRYIVFFGGAGTSTESGIPDFRSVDGLYNMNYKYPPETILSHTFFMRNPEAFYEFYRDRVVHREAGPNEAHKALSKLEKMGKLKAVVTQNIDGLHQMAGSEEVLELHGSIHRNYCMDCGEKYDLGFMIDSPAVPRCLKCYGIVRPDVVLYEEGLDMSIIEAAVDHISKSDLLIVGGTSLAVYPAASLVQYHKKQNIVLINKSQTHLDAQAKLVIDDSIGKILGQAVKDL